MLERTPSRRAPKVFAVARTNKTNPQIRMLYEGMSKKARHLARRRRVATAKCIMFCDVLSANLALYINSCSHRVMSCYLFSRNVTACHVTTCVLGPLTQ